MKFSLIFVLALAAFAAAAQKKVREEFKENAQLGATFEEGEFIQDGLFLSKEGIFSGFGKNFGKLAQKGLKEISEIVEKYLFGKAVDILTDGLRVNPTPEVEQALGSRSTEGIFDATANLIFQRVQELAAEQARVNGPSHEGILTNLGPFYKIDEAQKYLFYQYNRTIHGDNPSHEGIFGNLGGFVFNGLDDLIPGPAGEAIRGTGNIYGNLYYAVPGQLASQEGIIDRLGQTGLLTNTGKLVAQGGAKTARSLLKAMIKPYGDVMNNALFLYRGIFNRYSDILSPGKEALLVARAQIHLHPEAQQCIEAAERNLTQLLDQYANNGYGCLVAGRNDGQRVIAEVFDIIIDAVKRVEDAHREAAYCFDKEVDENKIVCLDEEVPAQIEGHKQKILLYGEDLVNYVRLFSDLNTRFDVCLTRHLGELRREVYSIIYDFHKCIDLDYQEDHKINKGTFGLLIDIQG